jgi:hypothetical protein
MSMGESQGGVATRAGEWRSPIYPWGFAHTVKKGNEGMAKAK